MKLIKVALALVLLAYIFQACVDNNNNDDQPVKEARLELPENAYNYNLQVKNEIPTLGRVLFYDKKLSLNNTVACASCHKQTFAFTDNARFSTGFENVKTSRNSMPIQNIKTGFVVVAVKGNVSGGTPLFWDGREQDLNTMVLRPILNHVEMGVNDIDKLTAKLAIVPYYKQLFTDAYGSDEITSGKISDALSAFIQSISSNNTKFDQANRTTTNILTSQEAKGKLLFSDTYNCNSCHQVETPNGYETSGGTFGNIGLDPIYADSGLANVTKRVTDVGKFKIPSLRNVIFTAPYMHDGRFETLEDVLDHYSDGIQDNPNLDPKLSNPDGTAKRMNIPQEDRRAIIAFLNTLTDLSVVTDPKFSTPFKTN